jgi:hypothetical protein
MIRRFSGILWLRIMAVVGLLALLPLVQACGDQVQATFLLHLKRPLSMVIADVNLQYCYSGNTPTPQFCFQDSECRSGETCKAGPSRKVLFSASADLNQISMIDVPRRRFFLDPDVRKAGIVYLKTGNMPVSLATSPDQKWLYVLHGADGDMMVYNLTTLKPEMDSADKNKELRFPKDCSTNNTCWTQPTRLKLFQSNNLTFGFVLLNNSSDVKILNLTRGNAEYGKVVQTLTLAAAPSDVFLSQDGKTAYFSSLGLIPATSSNQPVNERKVVFKLALDDLSKKPEVLPVGARTKTGAILDDNKTLYLVDVDNGGLRIYDIDTKKVVPQGDKRRVGNNIQLPSRAATTSSVSSGTFQSVQYVQFYQRKSDGSEYILQKGIWANASDGYGYFIDTTNVTLVDSDSSLPSTSNFRLVSPNDPNTNQLGDDNFPRVEVDKVETFDGQTRSETWTLTYEGVVVEGTGKVDTTKKTLTDNDGNTFDKKVAVGDVAVFGENCDVDTKKNDKGELCVFAVTKVEAAALTLDLGNGNPPVTVDAAYKIRVVKSYVVQGSVSGLLATRAKEETKYTTDFFALTIKVGVSATPRDIRFEFNTLSGFSALRVQLAGLPTQTIATRDQLACTKNDCKDERCSGHPVCTGKPCTGSTDNSNSTCTTDEVCNPKDGTCVPRSRLWILDPARSRFLVVDPTEELKLERFIQ